MGSSYTMRLIPSKSIVLQQGNCNLDPLDIINQPNKFKVSVKLVNEASDTNAIHGALEVIGQARLNCSRQTLWCRLSNSLLIGVPLSIKVGL